MAGVFAAAMHAGLVIAGARGHQPNRGLLGSAAQTLLQHSPAPLILVRGLMPCSGGDSARSQLTAAPSQ